MSEQKIIAKYVIEHEIHKNVLLLFSKNEQVIKFTEILITKHFPKSLVPRWVDYYLFFSDAISDCIYDIYDWYKWNQESSDTEIYIYSLALKYTSAFLDNGASNIKDGIEDCIKSYVPIEFLKIYFDCVDESTSQIVAKYKDYKILSANTSC